LDSNTEFDAKPELEIYADDVKCSHGSTSGNLDENSIFYLMSRGISKEDAKKLLINGFLIDVVNKITDEHAKELIKKIIGINEH
jgi:Fe-S cluster assembly protein SufD